MSRAVLDPKAAGASRQRREERRIGSRHPGLGAERQDPVVQRGAPLAVARPGPVDVDAEDGSLQVALMRHWADEMRSSGTEDGRQTLVAYVDDR